MDDTKKPTLQEPASHKPGGGTRHVWDDQHPLNATLFTPETTLSMISEATREALYAGYDTDEAVRMVWGQSYLIDSDVSYDVAQQQFSDAIASIDHDKYENRLVSFYIMQQKEIARPGDTTLTYLCMHTLLLAGLHWDKKGDRPLSFVIHQQRSVGVPHQALSPAVGEAVNALNELCIDE